MVQLHLLKCNGAGYRALVCQKAKKIQFISIKKELLILHLKNESTGISEFISSSGYNFTYQK